MVSHEGVLITKPNLCMLRGGVSPHLPQAMLQHHLGIWQLNSIYLNSSLSTQTWHHIQRLRAQSYKTISWPLLHNFRCQQQAQIVNCVSNQRATEFRDSQDPFLGFDSFTKVIHRNILLNRSLVYYKEYNWGTARWKRCLARHGAGGSSHALSTRILPATPYVCQPGKPFRFLWRLHYIFKID